jgi:cytochrome b pre-mRNA-processing protein 3
MAEPYRVLGATEQLFKASSKAADYHITEEARKNDQVELAKDGEEVGESLHPDSVWHHSTLTPQTSPDISIKC